MFVTSVSMQTSVLYWDGKVKGRAAVHHAFGPRSTAVPVNDALDVRQADACSLELLLGVQALKHSEHLNSITRIEPRPVVADENNLLAVATGSATNFYLSLRASAGELHCIGDQINQHQAQQGTVGPHCGQRMDFPDNVALLRLGLSIAHYLLDQLIEIDLLLLHLCLSDVREAQQVINQRCHLPRRPGNPRQMPEAWFGKEEMQK